MSYKVVEELDITSEGMKNQGYRVVKEGSTIALYHNGSCNRVGFYKNDWNKTTKKIEEKLGEAGIPLEIIQGTLLSLSSSYLKLMNGHAIAAAKASASIETETPLERMADPTTNQIPETPRHNKRVSNAAAQSLGTARLCSIYQIYIPYSRCYRTVCWDTTSTT